ncbi:protoporphyrinogen oxidase [Amycolatopsis australiensis]|uniref:Coproporphyrinogen III oxidase n=1 Tax=Amycolatopsis australiensis TaxID=546364 RepID=A0A1K1SYD0_9PSEU|nr:protoporphyrinogen oxidase [Amycolatopsis australiensis]SFW89252.1 oxygen-dependent protoporphyrinogen oxidase [Amycolatopsis australiensis]
MTRVAVVGGGVSGLTAAYRLRRLLGPDAEIVVFEKTKTPGGKLRTAELAGVPYDVGAEAFLVRRPEMLALVRELGLDVVHPTKARAKIHAGGTVTGLPPGTVMGVPASAESVAGVLSEAGRRAVEAEPALPPLRLPGGDLPLGPLLRERFGDELVDRLVDPLLGGVYAGGADGLGLRATMPGLASALAAGAGSLTAAAAAQLPANPSDAPVFGTVPGGLGTVIDRLTELSGAELRTGLPVCELARHGTGWRLRVGAAAALNEPLGNTTDADAVVLAVPAPSARRLLADLVPAASAAFGEVELASMAVVALALPPGTPLPDASGILIGQGERDASGKPYAAKAFTFSSRKWAHLGTGPVLVRGSVGRFGELGALQADDVELVRVVRDDLARLTGVTATPIETLVTRWGGGLPQYGSGHLERVERIEKAVAQVPGLAIAGATLHGVGLPACVATAEAAAQRVAAYLAS